MSETLSPSAIEAEYSIIGAILLSDSAANLAVDLIRPADFYRDRNRIIFESIMALAAQGRAIDVVTLSDHLKSRGELDHVGGTAALAEMAQLTGTSANLESHAKLVMEKAQLRRLLSAVDRIRSDATSTSKPVSEIMELAEQEVFEASQLRAAREPIAISDRLLKTFERIDELKASSGNLTGVTTGYPDIDHITSGWQKSDLIVIAGRPSMGKTSLVVNMMEAAAIAVRKPVIFFSMEMPIESVILRFLSSNARVPYWKIMKGILSDDEMTDLMKAADRLGRTQLYIDDSPNLTPIEVRSRCRRIAAQHDGLALVAIDYLQLMSSARKIDNRVQEVSEISRTLKSVARELRCPVIALSQLSRAPAQRADAKPQLSDLRDSGAIEQDADFVAFVHRDDYAGTGGEGGGGTATLLVRKHRNGPTGNIPLIFIAEIMRFESSAAEGDYDRETAVID